MARGVSQSRVEYKAMTAHQDALEFLNAGYGNRKPMAGLEFLYQKPLRTSDFFRSRAGLRAQELLRALLGARTPMLPGEPAIPRQNVTLQVFTPAGQKAVEVTFG